MSNEADWADEIAYRLFDEFCSTDNIVESTAMELRKAKADGIRAAAGLCGSDDFWPDHDRWFLEHRLTDVADKLEITLGTLGQNAEQNKAEKQ